MTQKVYIWVSISQFKPTGAQSPRTVRYEKKIQINPSPLERLSRPTGLDCLVAGLGYLHFHIQTVSSDCVQVHELKWSLPKGDGHLDFDHVYHEPKLQ